MTDEDTKTYSIVTASIELAKLLGRELTDSERELLERVWEDGYREGYIEG